MSSSAHLRLVVTGPLPMLPDSPEEDPSSPTVEALFQQYAGYVATIGLRLLGHRDQADDLVQDVFLEAYRARRKLQPGGAKRWLAVVAVRLAQRRLRRRRLRRFLHLDDGIDYDTQLGTLAPDPEQASFLAELFQLLDRLPTNERVAWALRHVHGEKLTEVARLCAVSLATAKRRIASANDKIQKELVWAS